MSAKQQVRAELLARRRAVTPQDRLRAGEAVVAHLHDSVAAARRVALYVPLADEPDTSALLVLRPDALLPVLLTDGDLDWTAGGDRLGVEAVASCDLVIVPALAVDQRGVRLGRGGGSYDRALRRVTGRSIAVLYDGEHLAMLPTEPHDVPVGAVVTPRAGSSRWAGQAGSLSRTGGGCRRSGRS